MRQAALHATPSSEWRPIKTGQAFHSEPVFLVGEPVFLGLGLLSSYSTIVPVQGRRARETMRGMNKSQACAKGAIRQPKNRA